MFWDTALPSQDTRDPFRQSRSLRMSERRRAGASRVVAPLLAAVVAAGAHAQPPRLRQLPVDAPDLRIEAQRLALQQRQGVIGVAPNGDIVIAPQMGEMVVFDSLGKMLPLKLPTGWQRDLEVRTVARIGWLN